MKNREVDTLEIIDRLCAAITMLSDIVRQQDIMLKQAELAGIVFDTDEEYKEEKEKCDQELDSIERKLKRI